MTLSEKGYVYFIAAYPLLLKVGYSYSPRKRMASISSCVPNKDYAFAFLLGAFEGTRKEEKAIHNLLSSHSLGHEWYQDSKELRVKLQHLDLYHGEDFYSDRLEYRGEMIKIPDSPILVLEEKNECTF